MFEQVDKVYSHILDELTVDKNPEIEAAGFVFVDIQTLQLNAWIHVGYLVYLTTSIEQSECL